MAFKQVRLNSREIARFLKSGPVADAVGSVAEDVADRAREIAPVGSGAYRDSIEVDSDTTDRAVALVVATVPYAMRMESRHGVLMRAAGEAAS